MLNRENGKKLVMLGFAAQAALAVLYLLVLLIFNGGRIPQLVSLASTLALLATAGGYALMWWDGRDMLDLSAAAALGAGLAAGWATNLFLRGGLTGIGILLSLAAKVCGSLIYVVLAARIKDINRFLALLLLGAFALNVGLALLSLFVPALPHFFRIVLIHGGNIVCTALCCLAAKQEP